MAQLNMNVSDQSVDMRSIKRWLAKACLLLATFAILTTPILFTNTAVAETQDRSEIVEQQVKAAYLFKFGSYVEWPPSAFSGTDGAFNIAVMGADALADELVQIVGNRTINGRPVTVRKLKPTDSLAGLNVHVLFIGRSNNYQLAKILTRAKGQAILTVSEAEDGLALGGMINFVTIDGRVRFEVAPKTAGIDNVIISARLLAAAYKVALGPS